MKGWVGLYGRPGAGYGRVLAPRMLMGLLLGCYVLGDPGGRPGNHSQTLAVTHRYLTL